MIHGDLTCSEVIMIGEPSPTWITVLQENTTVTEPPNFAFVLHLFLLFSYNKNVTHDLCFMDGWMDGLVNYQECFCHMLHTCMVTTH